MIITKKTKVRFLILLLAGAALAVLIIFRNQIVHPAPDTLKVTTFRVSGGWGFDVIVKGKIYIHQPFIPGVPGAKPFPDRKSALRAAKMVRAKMMTGRPPALTREDLVSIGIGTIQ
jgi:undecaprenyl pyrophosphate phosphatase UppP